MFPILSTSPKLAQSQLAPSSIQHPSEQQTTNDASLHHVHVPRHQPDVNEYKENDDRLTSTSVFPSSSQTFDENEHIHTKNERKYSLSQTTTTRDERLSVAKDMSISSPSSSNRIKTATNVQSDNNDVSSLNHYISSTATITASHSISSDASSPTRRFIPSSIDQQTNAYGNDESSPTFPSATSSSLLMHEQANHANEKYLAKKNPLNNDLLTKNSQTSTSLPHTTIEKSPSLFALFLLSQIKKSIIVFLLVQTSSTHSSPVTQSNELSKQKPTPSPSDVIVSSPSKQKREDNLSDVATISAKTTANGAVTTLISAMSSSSSSSSSLSVSTPSSAEHASRKQVLSTSTQVLRRASMSAPGAPITLILNKVKRHFFFLGKLFQRYSFFTLSFLGSKEFFWFNIDTTR